MSVSLICVTSQSYICFLVLGNMHGQLVQPEEEEGVWFLGCGKSYFILFFILYFQSFFFFGVLFPFIWVILWVIFSFLIYILLSSKKFLHNITIILDIPDPFLHIVMLRGFLLQKIF